VTQFISFVPHARLEGEEIMPVDSFNFDIFLSHNSPDKDKVRKLAERLTERGLRIWFDDWQITPANRFNFRIYRGLEISRTLLFCMSPTALSSEWVKFELSTFLGSDPNNEQGRFIPLLLSDCEIPDFLKGFTFIDYREESSEALDELVKVYYRRLGESHPITTVTGETQTGDIKGSVLPLSLAEDRFLQILLSKFSISRRQSSSGDCFELSVRFSDETPAIWNVNGKRYLQNVLSEAARDGYQKTLDDFLLNGRGKDKYDLSNPNFFFRYASGGTLPIIQVKSGRRTGSYYCLFYRDVYPVGWNIANGGSDTRAELLNPQETIERELREELIIADFEKYQRYAFSIDGRITPDPPAHAAALRLWARRFPHLSLLDPARIETEWQLGPDSVVIEMGNEVPIRREGFFLNINGEDFGIELDRICKITLPELSPSIALFDGELEGGQLVNSPVGLFNVDQFNKQLAPSACGNIQELINKEASSHSALEKNEMADAVDAQIFPCYKPDLFFFDGKCHDDPGDIDKILKGPFMEHLRQLRNATDIAYLEKQILRGAQYKLCPVTERIARRFLRSRDLTS